MTASARCAASLYIGCLFAACETSTLLGEDCDLSPIARLALYNTISAALLRSTLPVSACLVWYRT